MTRSRRDTQANLELIRELEAMGVLGVTTRKLERWRHAHAAPNIEQVSVGRGGTVTRWPAGTARQVAALVKLLDQRVPLRECPLALFHLGFPIDEAVVRAGYREMYRGFAIAIGDEGDPLDRSDAVARTAARRAGRGSMSRKWKRRLWRDSETDVEEALSAGFAGVIAGEEPTTEGVAAMLRAAGLDDGQDPAEVASVLSRLHVESLIDAIETATAADWDRARDACSGLFEMIRLRRAVEVELLEDGDGLAGLGDFTARSDVTPIALTPVFLVLASPEWVAALEDQLTAFRAVTTLLAEIPSDLRQYLGPAGKAIEPDQRVEVESRMVSWLREHPDVIAGVSPYLDQQ